MHKVIKLGIAAYLPIVALCAHAAKAESTPAKPAPKIPQPPADVMLTEDIVYGNAGGVPLYLELSVPNPAPEKALPAIIIIHGGGWSGGDRTANLLGTYRFAENGYVSASIEYRLSPQAQWPAQIQDCKCAVRYLRANAAKYHIDPDHIGVLGDSAGGHLVAMLGVTENVPEFEGDGGSSGVSSAVQAVCDMFGPADLVAWLYDGIHTSAKEIGLSKLFGGPVYDNLASLRKASPIAYIEQSKKVPPFLILHGDHDPNVTLQQSLWLADALQKKGVDVTLRVQLNAEHGGAYFFPNAWPDMKAFFDRTLKGQKD